MLKRSRFMWVAGLAAGLVGLDAGAASTPKSVQLQVECALLDTDVRPSAVPRCQDITQLAKQGWVAGRLDWYSGDVLLHQENGPFSVDSNPHVGWAMIFADGNGDPATFAAVYESPATSLLTAPALNFKLYLRDRDGSFILVASQDYQPYAAALWSKHNEETPGIMAAIAAGDAATLAAAKAYADAQDAALHAHIHQEIADEAAARAQGDADTLAASKAYTDAQVAAEAQARAMADANLQAQVDSKVASVSGADPIQSSGGTNPVISLRTCGEGEVLRMSAGSWQCNLAVGPAGPAGPQGPQGPPGPPGAPGGGGSHHTATYTENPGCSHGHDNHLTIASGCSYNAGCAVNSFPGCAGGCGFVLESSHSVCTQTCFTCSFFGCHSYCCGFGTMYCGRCDCSNTFRGWTVN